MQGIGNCHYPFPQSECAKIDFFNTLLEGMWRCGVVFGIDVPHPNTVAGTIVDRDLIDIRIRRDPSDVILHFWRKKAEIYKRFINHPETILWESHWATAVLNSFAEISLAGSLRLCEDDIFSRLVTSELPETNKQLRYKEPLCYSISPPRAKKLPEESCYLSKLGKTLLKEHLSAV